MELIANTDTDADMYHTSDPALSCGVYVIVINQDGLDENSDRKTFFSLRWFVLCN